MVGPSTSNGDRAMDWIKAGFVVVVSISGGLVSLRAGGGLETTLAAMAGGLVVGVVLVWLVFPSSDDVLSERVQR